MSSVCQRKIISENERKYSAEARAKYGSPAVDSNVNKILNLDKEQFDAMQNDALIIKRELEEAVLKKINPPNEIGLCIAALHKTG